MLAAVFLLALVFHASTRNRHDPNARVNCVGNLKQIGLAFQLWANDHGDKFPMQVPEDQGGALQSSLAGEVAPTYLMMSNELQSPKILLCPDDRQRYPRPNVFNSLSDHKISYFIGIDADLTNSHHILTGDRNIGVASSQNEVRGLVVVTNADKAVWTKLLHGGAGNVGYADGSVQQATTRELRRILEATGLRTNRLAVP